MSDSKSISLPPHLWEALDLMSHEMGVPSDALIAQAVYTLARLNGFVVPGRVDGASAPEDSPAPQGSRSHQSSRLPTPAPQLSAEDDLYEQEPAEDDYQDEPHDFPDEPEPEPAPPPPSRGRQSLTLFVANHEPYKMAGDVFTIGRGKSCDFVIESNRVSREHVRITREGSDFYLEDLNSSNGTFFGPGKEKVTRRKIKDGDEFTLGTEKIKFQLRR